MFLWFSVKFNYNADKNTGNDDKDAVQFNSCRVPPPLTSYEKTDKIRSKNTD